jgi:predicted DNA-binding transcriptional regulator AlpA
MIVAEKYGMRLRPEQIAEILGVSKPTLYNQLSAGTCPIPTYLENGKRFADYRDVAAYIDGCRERATCAPA